MKDRRLVLLSPLWIVGECWYHHYEGHLVSAIISIMTDSRLVLYLHYEGQWVSAVVSVLKDSWLVLLSPL